MDRTAAERMRRYRNKKRNETVTDALRNRNQTVTPETEADTETETDIYNNKSRTNHSLPDDWKPNDKHYELAT